MLFASIKIDSERFISLFAGKPTKN